MQGIHGETILSISNLVHCAGSAVSQNVGKLKDFERWKPIAGRNKWLLLAGASNPPYKSAQRRNHGNGDLFLAGVTQDLATMEANPVVKNCLFDTVRSYYLRKEEARRKVQMLFEICKAEQSQPEIYYTGHGELNTGNWCFDDGTYSILEIEDDIPEDCYYPLIISDCCYSGNWANYCLRRGVDGFETLAAAQEYDTADDTGEVFKNIQMGS